MDTTLGIVTLVVAVLIGGALTRLAWRVKHPIVKWPASALAALVTGA